MLALLLSLSKGGPDWETYYTDAFHCEIGHILVESSLVKNIPSQKCIDVGTVLFLVLFCVLEIQAGLELTL